MDNGRIDSLHEHDKKFHKSGYKDGDVCKYREEWGKNDRNDRIDPKGTKGRCAFQDWGGGVGCLWFDNENDIIEHIKQSGQDVRLFITQGEELQFQRLIGNTTSNMEKNPGVTYEAMERIPIVLSDVLKNAGYDIEGAKLRINALGIEHSTGRLYKFSKNEIEFRGDNVHEVPYDKVKGELLKALDNPIAILNPGGENGLSYEVFIPMYSKELKGAKPITEERMLQVNIRPPNVTRGEKDFLIKGFYPSEDPLKKLKACATKHQIAYINPRMLKMISNHGFNNPISSPMLEGGEKRHMELVIQKDIIESALKDKASTDLDYKGYELGKDISEHKIGELADQNARMENYSAARHAKVIDFKKSDTVHRDGKDLVVLTDSDEEVMLKFANNGIRLIPVGKHDKIGEVYGEECKNSILRILRTKNGTVLGAYDANTKNVLLVKGVDAEVISHEIGWHVTFNWAKENRPKLYAKLLEYANDAPTEIWEAVEKKYGNITDEEFVEELGAHRFTQEHVEEIQDAVRRMECNRWWGDMENGEDDIREAYVQENAANVLSEEELKRIEGLPPEEAVNALVKNMISGKVLPTYGESKAGEYLSLIKQDRRKVKKEINDANKQLEQATKEVRNIEGQIKKEEEQWSTQKKGLSEKDVEKMQKEYQEKKAKLEKSALTAQQAISAAKEAIAIALENSRKQ